MLTRLCGRLPLSQTEIPDRDAELLLKIYCYTKGSMSSDLTDGKRSRPSWWHKGLDKLRKEYHSFRASIRSRNREDRDRHTCQAETDHVKKLKRKYFNAVKKAKLDSVERDLLSMDETGMHKRFKTRPPCLATYDSAEILDHFFGLNEECPPSPVAVNPDPPQTLLDDLGGEITDQDIEP
ncbi:hypothetical protein FOZ63_003977, partial [Perkinsus olseni]